jgi:hypothetical protein
MGNAVGAYSSSAEDGRHAGATAAACAQRPATRGTALPMLARATTPLLPKCIIAVGACEVHVRACRKTEVWRHPASSPGFSHTACQKLTFATMKARGVLSETVICTANCSAGRHEHVFSWCLLSSQSRDDVVVLRGSTLASRTLTLSTTPEGCRSALPDIFNAHSWSRLARPRLP